jgi:hypothetical protein
MSFVLFSNKTFMRSIFTILLYTGLISSTFAQKIINDPNVVARNVKGFHSIEVSGGIDLYLSFGEEAAAVSAKDEATRNRIITEVRDGVLKIHFDWKEGVKLNFNNRGLKAYVSYKMLEKISASGGSDIRVEGSLKSSSLVLNISGGSDFSGRVDVADLNIRMSGGSDTDISGQAANLTIEASGGSDLNGYGLVTDLCTVRASAGSDVTITVNKELSAEASGGSDINWKGEATVKKSKASGAGNVSHRS